MAVATCLDKLATLIEYLDGLTERPPLDELERQIRALDVTADDLAEVSRFNDAGYIRNLVHGGKWHHLIVLCWRSGQRSPIHNHAGSVCGFRVLKGTGTETVFESTPSGVIKAVSSHDLPVGTINATQDSDIHQVSNCQAAGEDLITLHVYSPPLLRMDTYSLTDRTIGEFRPTFLEHSFGSGI
ncbi:MAG: cysteine dioxygenase family protein [Planctomycetes bacterium]|nr:cysteine dioxygenase family protein [Planctomycetota bacterium]